MVMELQAMIERYLNSSDTRSISSLAKRSKVPPTSVRRVYTSEAEKADFGTILKILNIVATIDEAKAFLAARYPQEAKLLLAEYKLNNITDTVTSSLEEALRCPRKFAILALADLPNGTSREGVAKVVGERGLRDIDELLDLGLIGESRGQITAKVKAYAPVTVEAHADSVRNVLPYLDQTKAGQRRQIVALHTRSSTLEGVQEAHAILAKAMADADQALNATPGNIPVFFGAVLGDFHQP